MYLPSLAKKKFAKALVVFTIASLVIFSNPALYVWAEEQAPAETSTTSDTPDTPPSTTVSTDNQTSNSTSQNPDADESTPPSDEDTPPADSPDPDDEDQGNSTPDTQAPNGSGSSQGGTVSTGNANAGGNASNQTNLNTYNSSQGTTTDSFATSSENTASSTPDTQSESDTNAASGTSTALFTIGEGLPASTTLSNTNDGTLDNNLALDATTGTNTATTTSGTSLINTGDAVGSANVLNVLNTNIVNSSGLILLLNRLFGEGTFDLRDFHFEDILSGMASSSCSLEACIADDAHVTITDTNNADITNSVVIRSHTGDNYAQSGEGDATINTGNAYAGANIVNVANTNIVNSNYLLLTINNFGSMLGDIVLPGMDFFKTFFANMVGGFATSTNSNTASVNNALDTQAQTGDNAANTQGTSTSEINTGTGHADSNVVNQINQNLFGGSGLSILFRIHGTWSGDVLGLPPGITWAQTSDGIEIFGEGSGGSGAGGSTSEIHNTNNATVNNNVSLYALTGDNKVDVGGEGTTSGTGTIHTGNAYAGANVVNLVNSNIVGRNMFLAVFNIFGDWNGNLSFGRPDLWIGGEATAASNPIGPGTIINYHYIIANHGDAAATNVVLSHLFNGNQLGLEGVTGDVPLGTIAKGGSMEVNYTGHISGDIPVGEIPVTLKSTLKSREGDGNPSDNSEEITVTSVRAHTGGGSGGGGGGGGGSSAARSGQSANQFNGKTADARIHIDKKASKVSTPVGSSVDYQLTIVNDGGRIYDSILTDTLTDETGAIIHEEQWSLDEIHPNEEVTVTYTMKFNASTTPGTYTNRAQVRGYHRDNTKNFAYYSPIGQASVVVGDGQVLGVQTGACQPYLMTFIRPGASNDPTDVGKLQRFLHDHESATAVAVTGQYNLATQQAVRAFQSKYAGEILGPWGATSNTGYVYLTTRKKINDLYCEGTQNFAFNPNELAEIAQYRAYLASLAVAKPHNIKPKAAATVAPKSEPLTIIPPAPTFKTSQETPASRPGFLDKIRGWFNRDLSTR